MRRASRQVTGRILDGTHGLTVADELAWLDDVAQRLGLDVPVTLHGLGGAPHRDLHALSLAYRSFCRRLRSRGLLGGGTAPVIVDTAALAEQTADLLAAHAAFARPGPVDAGAVRFRGAGGSTAFVLEPGWTRLHLILAETAHSAVVATQYVGEQGVGRPAAALGGEGGLLTLSCLPVTSDGRIVVARRSAGVRTDQGRWGPAVNGNLEMRPRFGIAVDLDRWGVPDPRRALAREAREELGISVDPGALEVLGLVRFDSEQQVATSVLLTSTLIDATAHDVVRQSRSAHATEGRWELLPAGACC